MNRHRLKRWIAFRTIDGEQGLLGWSETTRNGTVYERVGPSGSAMDPEWMAFAKCHGDPFGDGLTAPAGMVDLGVPGLRGGNGGPLPDGGPPPPGRIPPSYLAYEGPAFLDRSSDLGPMLRIIRGRPASKATHMIVVAGYEPAQMSEGTVLAFQGTRDDAKDDIELTERWCGMIEVAWLVGAINAEAGWPGPRSHPIGVGFAPRRGPSAATGRPASFPSGSTVGPHRGCDAGFAGRRGLDEHDPLRARQDAVRRIGVFADAFGRRPARVDPS